MSRKMILSFVLWMFFSPAIACLAQTGAPPSSRPAPPITTQTTNIPFFTLRDGMSSTLTLNNVAPTSTEVAVTIYNMEGRAHALDPITIDPHSYREFDLKTVLPNQEFNAGNIQIAYTSIEMGVTAQVSISSTAKRVSYESREPYEMQDMQAMMTLMSTQLAGIVSLPSSTADGYLAVTNSSTNEDTVSISVGTKQKSVILYPRQTKLLNLRDDFSSSGPGASLVKLQSNGVPGDIITTGFVLDLDDGYSSAFTMFDPSLNMSSHLAGAHLRIGEPDPSEGFPPSTKFHSPLLLANLSSKPVKAHILLDYTSHRKTEMIAMDAKQAPTEDEFKTVSAGDVTIPAGAVQQIELSNAVADLDSGSIREAGVDVDFDASPGALIGQLVSADQSGDYSFEVPVKDPAAVTELMEATYPWTVEDGTETVLHLKNATGAPANVLLTLLYYKDGGLEAYRHPLIALQPYQTVGIDITKLESLKTPDAVGNVLPASARYGQAQWHQIEPYTIIGRAEQVNVKEGIARSFSCNTVCCNTWSEYPYLSPSSLTGPVGSGGTLNAYVSGTSCNGTPFGPWGEGVSWSSGNTSVATVSTNSPYSTDVSFVGGGSTDVFGDHAGYRYYQPITECICDPATAYTNLSAAVTAQVPTSISVLSDTGIISITSLPSCTTADYGIAAGIHYQVLDQNGHALALSGMTPQEEILDYFFNGTYYGNPEPSWVTLGNATDSNGTFWDTPFGTCSSSVFTESFTQYISLVYNGTRYTVRNNTWGISSSSVNHGSISNSVDVRLSN